VGTIAGAALHLLRVRLLAAKAMPTLTSSAFLHSYTTQGQRHSLDHRPTVAINKQNVAQKKHKLPRTDKQLPRINNTQLLWAASTQSKYA
jgi:hypothetical protein